MKNIADLSEHAQAAFKLVVDNPGSFKGEDNLMVKLAEQHFPNMSIPLLSEIEEGVKEIIDSGLIYYRKNTLNSPNLPKDPNSIKYSEGYFPSPLVGRN